MAVLAGAGVSISSPSGLPSGSEFMAGVVEVTVPIELKEQILTLCHPVRRGQKYYGDFLRFEALLEYVRDTIDPGLDILGVLDDSIHRIRPQPNQNHYFLASLIKQGHLVFTTNFDVLIELAAANPSVGVTCSPLIDSQEYVKYSLSQCTHPLFKLHGSLKRPIAGSWSDCRQTIQATLDFVSQSGVDMKFDPGKRAVVQSVLQAHPLIVLGYSGYDDFDIIPLLESIPSKQPLIWISHADKGADPEHINWYDLERDRSTGFQTRACDFLYGLGLSGAREKQKLHLINAHTARVIDELSELYEVVRIEPQTVHDPNRAKSLLAYFRDWAIDRDIHDNDRYFIAGRILGSLGMYSQGVAHMVRAHEMNVSSRDTKRLLPVAHFTIDFCGQAADYAAALQVLNSAVPYLDDSVDAMLILFQAAFLMTKLPAHAFETIRKPLERLFGRFLREENTPQGQSNLRSAPNGGQLLRLWDVGMTLTPGNLDLAEQALDVSERYGDAGLGTVE